MESKSERGAGNTHSKIGPLTPLLPVRGRCTSTAAGAPKFSPAFTSAFSSALPSPSAFPALLAAAASSSRRAFISFRRTTARYSMRRFLIFSSPKWSASSCVRAAARNERSWMFFCAVLFWDGHGIAVSHSSCAAGSHQHTRKTKTQART